MWEMASIDFGTCEERFELADYGFDAGRCPERGYSGPL